MLRNYTLIAFRQFSKNKLFTVLNIFGLSLGIACSLMVYMYLSHEVSFDAFHSKSENIFRTTIHLQIAGNDFKDGSSSPAMGPQYAENIPEIKNYVRMTEGRALMELHGEVSNESFQYVEANFFQVFDFPFIYGQPSTALNDPNSIVLSSRESQRIFGRENSIGETVVLNIRSTFQEFTVSGIFTNFPGNSSIHFEKAVPISKMKEMLPSRRFTTWMDLFITTFLELSPDANRDLVVSKMALVQEKYLTAGNESLKPVVGLQPLNELHMDVGLGLSNGLRFSGNPQLAKLLAIIVVFILIVAGINFTNLSIASSLPRSKEVAIRKVIGAHSVQIRNQFLGEALILGLISFGVAILLTDLLLPVFNGITERALNLEQISVFQILVFAIALIAVVVLTAGLYPSIHMARFPIGASLKGKLRLGSKGVFTKGLIIMQFAISAFLIVSAMTIRNQISFMVNSDLGYDDRGIITISAFGEDGSALLERYRDELADQTFIVGITGESGTDDRTALDLGGAEHVVYHKRVDTDYVKTLGIQLVEGRDFKTGSKSDQSSALLVNEALVQQLGIDHSVGYRLPYAYWESMPAPVIVGVMKDYNFLPLQSSISPIVLHVHDPAPINQIIIKSVPGRTNETIARSEQIWKKHVSFRPFRYSVLEDSNKQAYSREMELRSLIDFATFLAVIISCLGLFGLTGLHIRQRTKEVGIRKAMGASFQSLLLALSRSYLLLITASIVMGSPLAWWMGNKWLQQFAYRDAMDMGLFIFSGLLLLTLALLTTSAHIIKTASTNPVNALRDE